MALLTIVLIAGCLPFVSCGWKGCPQSIPTVSYVSRCPADAEEWKSAAEKKDCRAVGMNQSCSNDGSFAYHCVLNEDGTMLMEVCAPIWYMSGYCARFSIDSKRIINDPDLDCSTFVNPCPTRFPSNESFKYQMCYKNVSDAIRHDCMDKMGYESNDTIGMSSATCVKQEQVDNPALIAFLAVFIIIALCLLILLICGERLKNMIRRCDVDAKHKDFCLETVVLLEKTHHVTKVPAADEAWTDAGMERNAPEDNGPAVIQETSDDIPQSKQVDEDSEKCMVIESLSESNKESVTLKGVENIGDLRESLCKMLDYQIELVWIIDKENGKIYQDNFSLNSSKNLLFTLMLGNKKRTDGFNEDGSQSRKSHRSAVKCRMNCGHLTDAESLFKLIRETLPETEFTELRCPLCSHVWDKSDLVKKCQMSDDEKLFLDRVLEVNERTKNLTKETRRNFNEWQN